MRQRCAALGVAIIAALVGCARHDGNDLHTSYEPALTQAHRDALRDELLAMKEVDQQYRHANPTAMSEEERRVWFEEFTAIDRTNTSRLKEIVAAHGWPTISMVGKDASDAAFLLVQHADHDPDFQARMLPVLEEGSKRGDVSKSAVAYLTDRVRVKQQRPQLYGTQYHSKNLPDGSAATDEAGNLVYLLPVVEDVAGLDARRAAMGLGPWAEYEAIMAEMQNRQPVAQPVEWDGELPVDPQVDSRAP